MSQCEKILAYLQSGKELTNADAAIMWDCYRLSGRIKELRDRGFNIERRDVPNKNGTGTHGVYYMKKEDTNGNV